MDAVRWSSSAPTADTQLDWLAVRVHGDWRIEHRDEPCELDLPRLSMDQSEAACTARQVAKSNPDLATETGPFSIALDRRLG